MNCPHCGAEISNDVEACPLCEKPIDKHEEYKKILSLGDEAFEIENTNQAVIYYEKALKLKSDSDEVYIKLGNAYNQKKDKRAAQMYLKAMEFNFYNDQIHNLLITIYQKYNKLGDLKAWYEKFRGKVDDSFIDRYLSIIDNIKYFKENTNLKVENKEEGFFSDIFNSMKSYSMLNAVILIAAVLVVAAIIGVRVFKINTAFILLFAVSFFFISIITVLFTRIKDIKKRKKENKSADEFFAEMTNKDRDKGSGVRGEEDKREK